VWISVLSVSTFLTFETEKAIMKLHIEIMDVVRQAAPWDRVGRLLIHEPIA